MNHTIKKRYCQFDKKNLNNFLFSFLIVFILLMLIVFPKDIMAYSMNGVIIWATLLLPSLFPFFFFSKLFIYTGLINKISITFKGLMKKFYNVSGECAYVFIISILSGYPVGSKVATDLYLEGKISKGEIKRLITFTSNSGPMFIIGTVGLGMLLNKICGLIILLAHIFSAILNGLIYRKRFLSDNNIFFDNPNKKTIQNKDVINSSMENSITSILSIGGYIVICFVVICIIEKIGIFAPLNNLLDSVFGKDVGSSFTSGIFEVTKGCLSISKISTISLQLKTFICSLLITFGGLCTCIQAMSFLKKAKISYKFFIFQKITQTIIACVITIILIKILL